MLHTYKLHLLLNLDGYLCLIFDMNVVTLQYPIRHAGLANLY